jgi:hypothetical protein
MSWSSRSMCADFFRSAHLTTSWSTRGRYSYSLPSCSCRKDASQAWWGFSSAADQERPEAFLRRAERLNFRSSSASSFSTLCAQADDNLFNNIINNKCHILFPLLPPKRDNHYSMRNRSHDHKLSLRTSSLTDNNFITRMLFKNSF